MRVPYLQDGAVTLTDSTSILMHLCQKAGTPFISDVQEMELYTMVNTAMDTTINLFLLERDGLTPKDSPYLRRQANRINAGLSALNEKPLSKKLPLSMAEIRLACYLDWALFRKRIDITPHEQLIKLLKLANSWSTFSETAPT